MQKLNPVYQAMKEARDKLGGGEEYPESLNELARLDTCVTVVDCRCYLQNTFESFAAISKCAPLTIAFFCANVEVFSN